MSSSAFPVIAVVGLSGAFPGAQSVEALWRNLNAGAVSVRQLSESDLRAVGVGEEALSRTDYVRADAMLDNFDCFDAEFFGISPRDAAMMDPQHRLLLEHAYAAIENAGYRPRGLRAPTGVYVGIGHNGYLLNNVQHVAPSGDPNGELAVLLGNDKSYAATRIAHRLNLRGPCLAVDTACSTSLVAIHMACAALLSHECDLALAGGARVVLPAGHGYFYTEGGVYARDGLCAPFDARATGTLQGSGVGMVVLKRLDDAVAAGDCIRALIRATAVNNDGNAKIDYAAPSVSGQAEVIEAALALADVDPCDIGCVETHGTGTALGDPIEFAALERAFRRSASARSAPCLLGALKANIGHLDAAAGVAGLIKAVGILESSRVPPLANFVEPNPRIDLQRSNFAIPRVSTALPKARSGRGLVAVSSFGIGGTNAHAVMEQAPERCNERKARTWHLLPIAARSQESLAQLARRMGECIDDAADLDAVALTLQTGRDPMPWRGFVVVDSAQQVAQRWTHDISGWMASAQRSEVAAPAVAFQFPGQGTLPVAAAALLYQEFPLLRRQLDLALADAPAGVRARLLDREALVDAGDEIEQVALVVLEYALARSLIELGVTPTAVIGHSLGEYVAAAVAGVFDLPTLIRLVQARGAAMAAMPLGAMLSIAISERETLSLLAQHPELDLAAVNAPRQCVVAGSEAAIVRIERHCSELGYLCRRLATRRAFHSRHTEAVAADFASAFAGMTLQPARLSLISNVSGSSVVSEPCDAAYWVQHMRRPVWYGRGIEVLLSRPATVVLELGPGQVLSGLVRAQGVTGAVAIPSQGSDPEASVRLFLLALGQLWQQGVEIDFSALYEGEQRVRAALPSYPFARTRHWLDVDPPAQERSTRPFASAPTPEVQLLLPSWRRAPRLLPAEVHAAAHWILVTDNGTIASGLSTLLRGRGASVSCIGTADTPTATPTSAASASVSSRADEQFWTATWQDLRSRHPGPMHIVYLRGAELTTSETEGDFAAHFRHCFLPLLRLAAIVDDGGAAVCLSVVTRQLFNVCGGEVVHPGHAPLLGATRVLAQEHSALRVRLIDLPAAHCAEPDFELDSWLVDELVQSEVRAGVALRQRQRWCESFEALTASAGSPLPLVAGGRYLILGGLGGIGRAIAHHFAAFSNVHLVLAGRAGLPDESEWQALLADAALDPELRARIECVHALRVAGCTIDVHSVDLRNVTAARDWLDGLGRIDGVVHAVGVAASGLSRLKTDQAMYEVMIAKIAPLLALRQSKAFSQLDFLLLCSSLTATVGGLGQADYAGANAYLEAFAASSHGRVPVLALAWDEWQATGMSARDRDAWRWWDLSASAPSWMDTHDWRSGQPFRLQSERDWVLREHRMGGIAVLPGTGVVDLMLSSFNCELPIVLRDLRWLAPAKVDAAGGIDAALRESLRGAERQLELIDARPDANGVFASAWSDAVPEMCPSALPLDLDFLRQRLRRPLAEHDGVAAFAQLPALRTGQLALGPRWRCLEQAWLGDGEVLGRLRLDARLLGDLPHFRTHPALMDVAAGLLAALLIDESLGGAVPVGIAELRSYAPLPSELWSWVRTVGSDGALLFDIDICDVRGRVLLALRGFELRRIRSALAVPEQAVQWASAPGSGITAAQALLPLGQLMSCRELSTVVFTRGSIEERRARWRDALVTADLSSIAAAGDVIVDDSDASELELELARLWAAQLGLTRLSLDQDFFELGGNSLSAMQVVAAVREHSGKALDVRALFDHPTLRRFAGHVAGATSKNALATLDPSLESAPRGRALPLSPQQQRLWFLSQMQDEAATYNIPIAMSLLGSLDIVRLVGGMRRLANANEVLRTHWQLLEDEPRQCVLGAVRWPLPVVDLSALDELHRAQEERCLLTADARRPFSWLGALLHRTTLLRHHAQHHVLAWSLHHAICDHWSIGILVRDLLRAYAGQAIEPQRLQYADYAWQQAQDGARTRREAGLEYWRGKLAEAPELLLLPTDFERPAVQTNQGGEVHVHLPASLVDRLERQANQHGVSLYMMLLAGFKAMLSCLTGQTRIVVGTPVANRVPAYQDAVGFFANTIAIYTRFNLDDRFVDLLEAVRFSALEAYDHQDVPFEQVVAATVERRSLAYAPLVQALLVLQNAPMSESQQADLSIEVLDQGTGTAKFDLALVMYQDDHGIRCVTEYRRDLFVEATVVALLDTYRTVLERISFNPELPISELVAHKQRQLAPKMKDEEFVL